MKRYFSHYTYIYPDIYLKSHIVEMDDDGKIIRWFPFEREIEKTEFYDGVVVFVPEGKEDIIASLHERLKGLCFENEYSSLDLNNAFDGVYKMFHGISLLEN